MNKSDFVEDMACMDDLMAAVHPRKRSFMSFEKDFDYQGQSQWVKEHWDLSLYFVVAYLILVLLGQRLMRERKAFDLQWALILWNFGLALLSIVATVRIIPEMVDLVWRFGPSYAVCGMSSVDHWRAVSFWGFLFTWSKVVELGDTAFIVLRKRPLIFLHCYHHITVLLAMWHGYGNVNTMGRWYMSVNFSVHTFMYSYYVLKALRIRVPTAVSMSITVVQILQMVFVFVVTAHAFNVKWRGETCCVATRTVYYGLFLSTTYFGLFLNYFFRTYLLGAFRRGSEKKKA